MQEKVAEKNIIHACSHYSIHYFRCRLSPYQRISISMHSSKYAFRLINKCLWKGGAEDLYKSSFRDSVRTSCASSPSGLRQNAVAYGRGSGTTKKRSSTNPMLNGVSMLQWFFDEVRPDQREVRYWMKYFSQATNPSKLFAVIQISEDVFEQEQRDLIAKDNGEIKRTILETLSLAFYFLQQNKMNILLLVGVDGQNSTFKKGRGLIHQYIKTLVDRLQESGTHSTPIFDGGNIFNTDNDFRIQSLNTDNLDWLVGHNAIPIIGCVGESSEGKLGLVQPDDGTHTLSAYTRPLKVLLLNAPGGISEPTGERVTIVFLPKETELQKYANQPWWNKEVEDRFIKVCDVLKVLPKQSSYVITSANDVLTELLTQRGVGTLFKRVAPVMQYTSLSDYVDVGNGDTRQLKEILPSLLETAFNRRTVESYWDGLSLDLHTVYLTDDLKACAIVRNIRTMPGVAYLDKFAVSKEERGNFSIDVLWQKLKQDYKSLYWRSRRNNIFNSWYESRSDGVVKAGYYHIFWFGLGSSNINSIVKQCQSLPDSFDD